MARSLAKDDLGVANALAHGKMAPPHLMDKHALSTIQKKERTSRLVVDGYPRYMEQLADLMGRPESVSQSAFIILESDWKASMARCNARRREDDIDESFATRWQHWESEGARVKQYLARRHQECTLVIFPDIYSDPTNVQRLTISILHTMGWL